MLLSDISIRRPVLATMLSLGLVLFGIIGYLNLPVRDYPDVDPPVISISTVLPGADPQVVESAVTDILEEELSTVAGLRTLTSSSAEQVSNITLEFNLDRNVDVAAQDVRDKVSRVRGRLPRDIEEPVVAKQEADAQPFFWLALSSPNYDLLQLSDIADRQVKARLQSLSGVGSAQIFGERRFSMRIWLSATELAARGLTVQDVEAAIQSRSVEVPAGRIESQRREFSVRSLGELKTPAEFEELTVTNQGGQSVRLRDLGRVELGAQDERSALRYNGTPAVAIGVVRQSKANLIQVAEAIKAELPAIQAALPPGVKIESAFDGSEFVTRSITEAQETLILAAGLVVIIIFLFLRNLGATIIPGLAIPTSIIATFAVMYFLGFSVNNLTLLALTLAIGIVVDDAIIVLENAYRHQEELGESPEVAATNGTREIAFAVIATTVSLVAVFIPLAFLKGNTGRLFNEFGIAVAGSVIISGFVALTLTPMLCARILRVPKSHGRTFQLLERGFESITRGYSRSLAGALRHRGLVLLGAVGMLVLAGVLFSRLKREFIPSDDQGWFLTFVIAPEGSSLAYTDGYQKQVEAIIANTPETESYFSVVNFGGGPTNGILFVNLKDYKDRKRTAEEIVNAAQMQMFGIPGIFAFASNPSAFGGGFGKPVQFVVQNPSFPILGSVMDSFANRARQIHGLQNVDTDLRINKPQLVVRFDRDRAEDLGVAVGDVAATLQTMLGGHKVNTYTKNNKLYDVIVQLAPRDRATPSDMSGLVCAGSREPAGPAQCGDPGVRGCRPETAQPLQPDRGVHARCQPRARLYPGRSGRLTECARRGDAAGGYDDGTRGRIARAGGEWQLALLRLCPGAAGGIHGAGLAVRVAGPPLHRAAGGAVGGDRCPRRPVGHRVDDQPLQSDRDDPADRPGDQELDPAGRVCQQPAGAGPHREGGDGRGGPYPPPADHDDLGRDGHQRRPDCTGAWRRIHQPPTTGLRHHRRRARLDGAHALSRPRGVYPAGSPRRPASGGRPDPGAHRVGGNPMILLLLQLATAPALAPADTAPVVTLDEALARSVRLNPDYVSALGSVAEADWARKAARIAFLVPAVNVSLDYAKYSEAFFNIGTFNQSSTSSTFQLDARYDISARKFAELGRTAAELEAATATEVQRRYAAALLVEAAYYGVLADQELARVARQRTARAEDQLAVARARVSSGAAVQSDSLTVRLELLRARVDLLRLESSLRLSQLELGRRIGVDGPAGAAPLDSVAPEPLPITLTAAIVQALEQGPEYRAARARSRAAESELTARRRSYLPTLSVTAAHSRFDVKLFPGASNVSSLTITASLPIWNNGQRELQILQARTQRDVARAIRSDLERSTLREVTGAYDEHETARAEVELAEESRLVAAENYRVQDARYRAGASSVLDLLLAQNGLSEAEGALVRSRYTTRLARARLEAILGSRLTTTQGGGQ